MADDTSPPPPPTSDSSGNVVPLPGIDAPELDWALYWITEGWWLTPLSAVTGRPSASHFTACGMASCDRSKAGHNRLRADETKGQGHYPAPGEIWVAKTPADVQAVWGPSGTHKGAGIAGITGPRSCCGSDKLAIDMDVKDDRPGMDSLKRLNRDVDGGLGNTRCHSTPSDGVHLIFEYPGTGTEFRNRQPLKDAAGDDYVGLDIRGWHGYVRLPGTRRRGGGAYEVLRDVPPGQVPPRLVDLLRRPERGVTVGDTVSRARAVDPVYSTLKPWQPDMSTQALRAGHEAIELAEPLKEAAHGSKHAKLYDAALKLGGWLHLLSDEQVAVAANMLLAAIEVAAVGDDGYDRDGAVATIADAFAVGAKQQKWGWPRRPFNDTGNGERLLDHYGEKLRYLPETSRPTWAGYDGGVWTWGTGASPADVATLRMLKELMRTEGLEYSDEPGEIIKAATKDSPEVRAPSEREEFAAFVGKQHSRTQTDAVPRMAAKLKRSHALLGDFDRDPRILNVANGTLWLARDGSQVEVRDHYPELMMSKQTRAAYVPGSTCPSWDKLFADVFPDEILRHWVQVAIAESVLLGGNLRHWFVIFLGDPRNGKTTVLEALGYLLGTGYALPFERSLLTDVGTKHAPRPDIVNRLRCRLVYSTETADHPLDANAIKRLSGGDSMSARNCFANAEATGAPEFTPIMAQNSESNIPGLDDGVIERLLVIPFGETVPVAKRDKDLPRKLREQADGILTKLVGLLADVKLLDAVPEALQTAKAKATKRMSLLAMFIDEEMVQGDSDAFVSVSSIGHRYDSWCDRNHVATTPGAGRQNTVQIAKLLRGLGWQEARQGHQSTRGFKGWRLRMNTGTVGSFSPDHPAGVESN